MVAVGRGCRDMRQMDPLRWHAGLRFCISLRAWPLGESGSEMQTCAGHTLLAGLCEIRSSKSAKEFPRRGIGPVTLACYKQVEESRE